MNVLRKLDARVAGFVFVALAAVSAVGCSEPANAELQGTKTAKLLAPKAVFRAKASQETKKALGIVEWRVFRGKRDIVLTGYDAKGKAKKGVSVGFHSAEKGVKASLRARVLDGTMFAARHEYGGSSKANGDMSKETQELLGRAFRDARGIRAHLLPSRGEVPLPNGGAQVPTTPLPQQEIPGMPGGGAQCGGDLMTIIMAAMQCVQQTGGSIQQCAAAVQAAQGLGGACQGPMDPQAPPYDPMGGGQGGPYDPCGGMGDPYGGMGGGDPYGGMGGGDPYGGMGGDPMGGGMGDPMGGGMGDPMGGGMCGDPMGGGAGGYPGDPNGGGAGGYPGDPNGGGAGGYPGDPNGGYPGGGMDDPFGDGGMCPSCGGGAGGGYPGEDPSGGMGGGAGGYPDDIYGDPMSGQPGFPGEGGYGGGEGGYGGEGGFGEGY